MHDCQKNGRNGLFTEAEVAAGFAVLDSATAAEDLDAIKGTPPRSAGARLSTDARFLPPTAICTGAFTNVPCWTDTPNAATAEHAYVDQYRAFKWDPVEGWVIFTALGSRQQYVTVCKTTV